MNFTFADISSVYMNMVRKDLSKEVPSGSGKGESEHAGQGIEASEGNRFEQKLSRTMDKVQQAVSSGNTAAPTEDNEKITEFLLEKLEQGSGSEFAAALKTVFIMLSGGDLRNIALDGEGLDALTKMLVEAGFSQSDIDEMILELTGDNESGAIRMDALFDKLFDLSARTNEDPDTASEFHMETSAAPILESILASMGVGVEKINQILSKADRGENGFSLDELITELKLVRRNAFYQHTQYRIDPDNENAAHILKQIGFFSMEKQGASFSLDDLVAALETMRKNLSSKQAGTAQSEIATALSSNEKSGPGNHELMATLLKHVKNEGKVVEKSGLEISGDQIRSQIKDQFKSALGALGEKVLEPEAEASAGYSKKKMLKTAALGMDEKSSAKTTEPVTLLKEERSDVKPQRSGNQNRGGDASHTAASENRTTGPVAGSLKTAAPLKNLPTFVTKQVSRSIVRAVNQGENVLRIQLKPAELGRLMMTIDNTGNTMKVSIMTESLAAKEILTSNVTELKSVLSNSGVNLERFDVDMNSDFRQSMADTRQQSGNSSGRGRGNNKTAGDENRTEDMNEVLRMADLSGADGSLHYVA